MRLVAFCEAAADFQIASDLFDRVLRHRGPTWVADTMEAAPEAIRSWRGDGRGRDFFLLRDLVRYVDERQIRVPYGHFDGRPGAADALMGRTALSIVRQIAKHDDVVDAVLMIRDLDDQPARKTGLGQARAEARSWATFEIVLGCANPKREAWVLCGFEPENAEEHARLSALRTELGFPPHIQGHQLDAKDEQAKRNAKRVLRILTGDDRAREQQCWKQVPLDTLRDRGVPSGLCEYLDEIEQRVLPLVTRA
jgi:hypothetical protein